MNNYIIVENGVARQGNENAEEIVIIDLDDERVTFETTANMMFYELYEKLLQHSKYVFVDANETHNLICKWLDTIVQQEKIYRNGKTVKIEDVYNHPDEFLDSFLVYCYDNGYIGTQY